MAYKILREIRKDLPRFCGRQIAISVNPRVAEVLLARAHKACAELGQELGCKIEIRGQPGLHQEQFEVTALDSGPPVSVPLQWLGSPPESSDETASTAELPIEADEPSSAAAPDTSGPGDAAADSSGTGGAAEDSSGTGDAAADSSGPGDAAADKGEPAPTPPELEAPREAAVEEIEQGSGKSTPAEAAVEAAPPENDSTEGPAIAASAGAAESGKRLAAQAPAVEMLDLEPETPILPPPAKVEEP
jgi:hypothetical protein